MNKTPVLLLLLVWISGAAIASVLIAIGSTPDSTEFWLIMALSIGLWAIGFETGKIIKHRISKSEEQNLDRNVQENRKNPIESVLCDQFVADDDNSNRYTILVFQEKIDARTKSNPYASPINGLKTAKTSEDLACKRIDDDTFSIIQSGVILRRANIRKDPNE